MYEYKFVRVKLKGTAISLLAATKPQEDYQEIVHQHAAQGWRLVQIFAPATASGGYASYFELIFERPKA